MEDKSIVLQYEYITDPVNLAEILGLGDKFTEWLNQGNDEDLRYTLEEFEKHELYEHCAIIHKMLVDKHIQK